MALEMFEEISAMRQEAAAKGVASVVWSYPRGEAISKDGETAIDVAAYAAQIAALLGAHVIKIKLSTDHLMLPEAKKVYEAQKIDIATQAARVRHCMESSFNGRRIVVFSGGAKKGEDSVYDDARAIRDGGGNGSIIGRNSFQRSREDALVDAGQAGRHLQGQSLIGRLRINVINLPKITGKMCFWDSQSDSLVA